jgi:hypothetical protein
MMGGENAVVLQAMEAVQTSLRCELGEDIEEGTVVACFVAVRELREERRVNAPD